jgi:succinate dehydrogenase/fumarate reductase flavoprotein subunit
VCGRYPARAASPGEPDLRMAAKYHLVVLGAGPAGEKGAAQAAYFGKRVAIVDPIPGRAASQ